MEKENKKARDEARKEYNETVRALTMFIRKRDPRYKAYLAQQQAVAAAKASAKSSGQSTTRRATAPMVTFVEQAWQMPRRDDTQDADLEWAVAEGAEDEEEWECVACGKTFRSEAAWDSHERSKKHLQAVERLKQQMAEENEELGLDNVDDGRAEREDNDEYSGKDDAAGTLTPASLTPEAMVDRESPENELALDSEHGNKARAKSKQKKKGNKQVYLPSPPSPELSSRAKRRARDRQQVTPDDLAEAADALRLGEPNAEEPTETDGNVGVASEPVKAEMSKREKRRAREAAKKEKEAQEAGADLQCLPRDIPEQNEAFCPPQHYRTCPSGECERGWRQKEEGKEGQTIRCACASCRSRDVSRGIR